MPRDLLLGNGRLLVDFDEDHNLRDVYYPHAGQPNHAQGHVSRLSAWTADAGLVWLGEGWHISGRYRPRAAVTDVRAMHPALRLELRIEDAVLPDADVLLRRVTVHNLASEAREVRLFWHLDLSPVAAPFAATALYWPPERSLLVYKGKVWFLLGGQGAGPAGLSQFTTGHKTSAPDAEDGRLDRVPASTGSVDAIGAVHCRVPGQGESAAYFWLLAAPGLEEALAAQRLVVEISGGPGPLIDKAAATFAPWLERGRDDYHALPERLGQVYETSLLVILNAMDREGGVIASPDSQVQATIHDTYQYVWPRDSALVAHALDLAGHSAESHRVFQFLGRAAAGDLPWLWHKYNPDGSRGGTWLSAYDPGHDRPALPTEEDDTALAVWALAEHARHCPTAGDCLPAHYASWARRAADWLATYRGADGLPGPSVDLWEGTYGVWSFTAGAVVGALRGAARLAHDYGAPDEEARYAEAAQTTLAALERTLYDGDLGRFMAGARIDGPNVYPMPGADASVAGLWLFGALEPGDPRIVRTVEAVERELWLPTEVGGVARSHGDTYHQRDRALPGNPWIITTLWLARWHLALGHSGRGRELLEWAATYALPSGILPEQVDPHTGGPVSVSPLTWSHADYVWTALAYLDLLQGMPRAEEYGRGAEVRSHESHELTRMGPPSCRWPGRRARMRRGLGRSRVRSARHPLAVARGRA